MNAKKKLVIDVLTFEKDKVHSFQEYIFDILDYFYSCRNKILFDKIILVCRSSQSKWFEKYRNVFEIKTYTICNTIHKYIIQVFLSFDLNLNNDDLIFYPGNYTAIYTRCKNLLVIHDLAFFHKTVMENKFMRIQRRLFTPISIKNAEAIIAISKFTANEIRQNYNIRNKKIYVIYNYFNFEKYNSMSFDQEIDYSYFLSVSSSANYKNAITILKAFVKYFIQGGNLHLIFVGALSNTRSEAYNYYQSIPAVIRAKIHLYENISNEFLGFLYKNAKCFLTATTYEGLGMPIVEAMSFNKPVIASNLEICKEVSMGKAVYFDTMNVDELCLLMRKYKEILGVSNLSEEIKNNYSKENTSAKYLEIINSLYES